MIRQFIGAARAEDTRPCGLNRIKPIQGVLPFRRRTERRSRRGGGLRRIRGAIEAVSSAQGIGVIQMVVNTIGEKKIAKWRCGCGVTNGVCRKVARAGLNVRVLVAEFSGGKPPELVFLDRPSKGPSVLFPIEWRFCLASVESCRKRLQIAIPFKHEGRSMKRIGSGSRNDVDDAVARAADLRGEACRSNLKFAD